MLTLLVVVDEGDADAAIEAANAASRQHPCRIIVVVAGNKRGTARLDAQIRLGGDAGASEVVVLRLYGQLADHGRAVVTPLLLADSPIVAWWPTDGPADPVGATRSARWPSAGSPTPPARARRRAPCCAGSPRATPTATPTWPGRGSPCGAGCSPRRSTSRPTSRSPAATVVAATDSPSGDLLAGWLAVRLRCPVSIARARNRSGIISVRLERASGTVDLVRPLDGNTATLSQPGQPVRTLALPHRGDAECLADELRRLDPDEVYEDALVTGLRKCTVSRQTAAEAVRAGKAPSVAEAERTADPAAQGGPGRRQQRRWSRPSRCPARPTTPPR